MIPPIVTVPFMHLDELRAHSEFVDALRDLNNEEVQIPWAWSISTGPDDPLSPEQESLTFGINNEVGILMWTTHDAEYVPTSGTNATWTGYFLAGSDETSVPPFAEVPVETVYAALTEFLRTGERPTNVDWQNAAPIETMFSAADGQA